MEFLKALATSYFRPPYLFVHAGVLPTRQLEEQTVEDMLWIRQDFIFHPHQLGATVVFGHTPMRAVMVDLPYKLGIDTGLVYGGKLSCVEFIGRGAVPGRTRQPAGAFTIDRIALSGVRFCSSARADVGLLSFVRWRRSSVG